MSVLGRRLAATEGAYFLQESKNAVGRRAVKIKKSNAENSISAMAAAEDNLADILPEVLRHSIPLRGNHAVLPPSMAGESKWNLSSDVPLRRRIRATNPLKDFLSLPQVTLGPKRWQLPEDQSSVTASTANELRRERYHASIDPEKMKAAAAGMSRIGAAFAVASALVFGGAASGLSLAISKLHVESTDDVRDRGRDLMKPTAEIVHAHMAPFRAWAERNSREWKSTEKVNEEGSQIMKELSKTLGRRDR